MASDLIQDTEIFLCLLLRWLLVLAEAQDGSDRGSLHDLRCELTGVEATEVSNDLEVFLERRYLFLRLIPEVHVVFLHAHVVIVLLRLLVLLLLSGSLLGVEGLLLFDLDPHERVPHQLFGVSAVEESHRRILIVVRLRSQLKETVQDLFVVRRGESCVLEHRHGAVPEKLEALLHCRLDQLNCPWAVSDNVLVLRDECLGRLFNLLFLVSALFEVFSRVVIDKRLGSLALVRHELLQALLGYLQIDAAALLRLLVSEYVFHLLFVVLPGSNGGQLVLLDDLGLHVYHLVPAVEQLGVRPVAWLEVRAD